MPLEISFTKEALEYLEGRPGREIVIDLVYKKGRCTSTLCKAVPNVEVYVGEREGRYTFEPLISTEGRVVHVAKPLIEKAEDREVKAVVDRRSLRGLTVTGVDPYELGL